MTDLRSIISILQQFAPLDLMQDWDNSGLQIGRIDRQITGICVALDVTEGVLEQAVKNNDNLVVTHHPLIFHKLNSVTDLSWQKNLILTCAERGIAVYSMHTNFDAALGGINDILAKAIGLSQIQILDDDSRIGRHGTVKQCGLKDFVLQLKNLLQLEYVTVADGSKPVHQVAVCGGAGADFIAVALAKGCDTFITGDVKYHEAQEAVYGGLNIIDVTHQGAENFAMRRFCDKLKDKIGDEMRIDWADGKKILEVI